MENDIHHHSRTTVTYLVAQSSTQTSTPTLHGGQQPLGLDWTTIIVAVVTGVISGVIAPVISPYAKWFIDRKKRQENRNEEIIEELRKVIENRKEAIDALFRHRYFPYLKEEMSAKELEKLNELRREYYSHKSRVNSFNREYSEEYVEFARSYSKEIEEFTFEVIKSVEKRWKLTGQK